VGVGINNWLPVKINRPVPMDGFIATMRSTLTPKKLDRLDRLSPARTT
jgi:hypothetical protein